MNLRVDEVRPICVVPKNDRAKENAEKVGIRAEDAKSVSRGL